jgi:acyl-coenzyme A thioesterase PaaI-like protein
MTSSLIVAQRFNGPPQSAHGGYICGLIAAATGANVRVRLYRPPPLATEFEISERPPDEWRVTYGKDTIATATRTSVRVQVPAPPNYLQAMDASLHFPGLKKEVFSDCFVCGEHRKRGDGLRVFPGHVPGGIVYASPWLPSADLADDNGKIKPEFIWSVLDCPGYYASFTDLRPALLGEFTVHIDRSVHVDEACVVIGWPILVEGRKHKVGTALFDEDGERCALGIATWVETKPG